MSLFFPINKQGASLVTSSHEVPVTVSRKQFHLAIVHDVYSSIVPYQNKEGYFSAL